MAVFYLQLLNRHFSLRKRQKNTDAEAGIFVLVLKVSHLQTHNHPLQGLVE